MIVLSLTNNLNKFSIFDTRALTTPNAMKQEVTIYDLADKLKLSPSTISRALNNHPAIKQETKDIVHSTAQELGYRQNVFAKNLRARSTMTIGIIIPKIDSYFLANVVSQMEHLAQLEGYNMIITQSQESLEKERANAKTLFDSRIDGLLVSTSFGDEDYSHFEPFFERKIPTVFFDRTIQKKGLHQVIINNRKAGKDATLHLLRQGCKNLLHVTGNIRKDVYKERYLGFLDAHEEMGLQPPMKHLEEIFLTADNSRALIKNLYEKGDIPDGIFVTNDNCLAAIQSSLKELGYDIPKDIALFGFNDDPIATVVEPKLSTIHYSAKDVGAAAIQRLLSLIKGESIVLEERLITLDYEVMIRASSEKLSTAMA